MSARFIVADVFDGLATLEDGSVDLCVSSPPFLALRSYLPADHPDKGKEIGSEATPAEWLDTMLAVTAELRRVLAPHGSIAIELGDTYAGSGGAGGDYLNAGLREGQPKFDGSAVRGRAQVREYDGGASDRWDFAKPGTNSRLASGDGWPLAKSKALIPELYRIALAYGINPLTGQPSPAGRWRVRNVVTWCRPNPPVGALGDKWRPATSDIVIACTSDKRYWDDIATRRPADPANKRPSELKREGIDGRTDQVMNPLGPDGQRIIANRYGAPLLDWWEIPPGGYPGSHYAVYPPALVEPLIKAMAPPKVCRQCGEPSRRIVETTNAVGKAVGRRSWMNGTDGIGAGHSGEIDVQANDRSIPDNAEKVTVGWTDCGCDCCGALDSCDDCVMRWRPAVVLDPFAGSGTTLAVATGHGHDAIGIDLDERNYSLALERVGPLVLGPPEKPQPKVEVGS